jgi:endonuclease III
MEFNNRIKKIYNILEKDLKKYEIPLANQIQIKTKDPFFVLIGTILSSRTKDTTTSKICNRLFTKVKSFNDLKKINLKKLEDLLYGVGFYKQKAKYLKKLPLVIEKDFNNKIPENIEDLIKLPGVGRKTANLVRSLAFNKPAICVDVHVHRIFNRIGLINTNSSLETEMKLREILPKRYWKKTNYLFVKLGQNICRARSPKCYICKIEKYCNYNKKN